jgi:hypothetical protein
MKKWKKRCEKRKLLDRKSEILQKHENKYKRDPA